MSGGNLDGSFAEGYKMSYVLYIIRGMYQSNRLEVLSWKVRCRLSFSARAGRQVEVRDERFRQGVPIIQDFRWRRTLQLQ